MCLKALRSRLHAKTEAAIDHFEGSIRKRLYARIDKDVSNDQFKGEFKCALEDAQAEIQRDLPERIKREFETFSTDVSDVVDRFQQFVQELMDSFGNAGADALSGKVELKINIDNGIRVQNLLVALVGGALMFWNPAGWFVLATGAAALLVSVGKALHGVFSSDYKKSQQRKAVDDNLREIVRTMRDSICADRKKAFPAVQGKIEEIQEALAEPVRQITGINDAVRRSIFELKKLSNSIAAAGTR